VTGANAIANNRLFLVSSAVKVTYDGLNFDTYPAEFVDRKTAEKFLKTPINYPWIPVPKVTSFQVRHTDNTLTKGLAVYVDPDLQNKHPLSFMLQTEWIVQPNNLTIATLSGTAFDGVFSDAVLYEIINRAALLMLDNIESQRTQIKAELNKLQE
jgi:hypothetical protein